MDYTAFYNRLTIMLSRLTGIISAVFAFVYRSLVTFVSFMSESLTEGFYWFFRSETKKTPAIVSSSKQAESRVVPATKKASSVNTLTDKLLMFESTRIDNPGKGDCMFYAVAIGLVNIIQQENLAEKTTFFDQWVELDATLKVHYDAIIAMDLKCPDKALLDVFQKQLRQLVFNVRIKELRVAASKQTDTAWLSNSTYTEFAGYFFENTVADVNNPFHDTPIHVKPPRKGKQTEAAYDHAKIRIFLNFLYGAECKTKKISDHTPFLAHSPIVDALAKIKYKGHWGTYSDLTVLAELFKVNLHVYENRIARFDEHKDIPTQHTLIINNEGNLHWTTQIIVPCFKQMKPANFTDHLRNTIWKQEISIDDVRVEDELLDDELSDDVDVPAL